MSEALLSPGELSDLKHARDLLETDSLAVRMTVLLGQPIEQGLKLLPEGTAQRVHRISKSALERALRMALSTMGKGSGKGSTDKLHKLASVASGAVGGVFGLGGLAVELPVTTVIMFRSIADIARAEGHELRDAETRMACLEVFALGGPGARDDAAETSYYAVRATLAKALTDAAQHIAQKGMAREGAPVLVKVVEKVAARFGIVVQEKVALGAVPVLSALSGSMINAVFMEHFQNKARGHFIVRRLEASHGPDIVRRAYEALREAPEVL